METSEQYCYTLSWCFHCWLWTWKMPAGRWTYNFFHCMSCNILTSTSVWLSETIRRSWKHINEDINRYQNCKINSEVYSEPCFCNFLKSITKYHIFRKLLSHCCVFRKTLTKSVCPKLMENTWKKTRRGVGLHMFPVKIYIYLYSQLFLICPTS